VIIVWDEKKEAGGRQIYPRALPFAKQKKCVLEFQIAMWTGLGRGASGEQLRKTMHRSSIPSKSDFHLSTIASMSDFYS
jgi:hypothetical protein